MELVKTIASDYEPDYDSSEDEVITKQKDFNTDFLFSANDSLLTERLQSVLYEKGSQAVWNFDAVRQQMGNKLHNQVDLDATIANRKIASESEAESENLDQIKDDESVDHETVHNVDLSGVVNVSQEDRVVNKKVAAYFEEQVTEKDEVLTQTFTEMNLSRPLLKALTDVGFTIPTKIQAMAIPLALQGRDICGAAQTGSGKSGAFLLPILERLLYKPRGVAATRVLIMTPTRELSAQCYSVAVKLAKYTDITFALCTGGLSTSQQEAELKKRPDVVIATPGRLIDHMRNSASFGLDDIEILVMDEADRMLEDGFQAELTEIIKDCPHNSQRLLFSATMTDNVDSLIQLSLHRPVRLFIDSVNAVATKLVQEFVRVRVSGDNVDNQITRNNAVDASTLTQREAILVALCMRTCKERVIIFFPSKMLCHRFRVIFGLLGLKAAELHGNLTQMQRIESLEQFRDGKVDFLLATDLASRGLDIVGIETVINFQMPLSYERYVHRVGRTARNDRAGRAVTLVGEKERKMVKQVLKNLKNGQVARQRVMPSEVVKKYKQKIADMSETISLVLSDEKEEKQLRSAEMQLKKAENVHNHSDEIMSRPKRTWFQNAKQKLEEKKKDQASAQDYAGLTELEKFAKEEGEKILQAQKPKGPLAGLSRKQKRKKLAQEDTQEGDVAGIKQKVFAKAAKKQMREGTFEGVRAQKKRKSNKLKGGFSKEN